MKVARALVLALLIGPGCGQRAQNCAEPGRTVSPLVAAPPNGAQYGGMTIDASGLSEGGGAPEAASSSGHGLLRLYVVLSAPGAGLSGAQRSALAETLDDVRGRGGLQAFVRFYYENPITSKANAADTVQKVASDIADAKSVLTPRLDAIPFFQAGFLGPWGEWWSGDLEGADFGTDQQLRTLKTGVVNALKSAFPTTFIQLRYPRDIATYYADDPQIAFHDDSVLAGSDDGGTFNATKKTSLWPDGNPGAQRTWIKARNARLLSVNAGEASQATPDVSCDALLAYLNEYRIFVFNVQWPDVVTKCTEQLKNQLRWSGPLAPVGGDGGSGGAGGGSGGSGFGTELGCWATDQRPWQLCNPDGCEAERCRRAPGEACAMYRTSACSGSWPPAGYPGEETVSPGGGGGAPSAGSGGSSAGAGEGPSGGRTGSGGDADGGGVAGAATGGSSGRPGEPSGAAGSLSLPGTSTSADGDCP